MDFLIHIANVIYFASYSARDILWLRMLTVLGLCLCVPYFSAQGSWAPVFWHVVFVFVNLIQIWILFQERRPVQLSEDEQLLHEGPLRTMTPQQVRRLVRQADWCEASKGVQIVAEGVDLPELILLHTGAAHVQTRGRRIAHLNDRQFVGEMSFLTGEKTSAEVIASEDVRYLRWPESVFAAKERDPDLYMAIQAALGADVVGKLLKMRD